MITLLFAALSAQPCVGVDALLDQASDRAAELQLADARIAEARGARGEVRSLWRPRLDAYADSQVGDTELTGARVSNQAGLQLSQRLFDWGDATVRARLADAAIAEQEAQAMLDAQDLRRGIAGLIASVFENDAQAALQDASLQTLERRLEALEGLVAEGLATRQGIAALKSDIFSRRSQREEAALAADRARLVLEQRYAIAQSPCAIDAYRAPAASVRLLLSDQPQPGELAASARARAARAEAKLTRLSRLPIVEATGRLSYASSAFDDGWRLREQGGISLRAPIYAGNAITARARQSDARVAQAEAELALERQQARAQAAMLVRTRESLARQVVLIEEARDEIESELSAVEERLAMGAATLDELIETRRRHDVIAANAIAATARLFELEVEIAARGGS